MFPKQRKRVDQFVCSLREQIKNEPDPSTIRQTVAAIHLDSIARLRAYSDQLDLAIGYELFDWNRPLEESFARAYAILRLMSKLHAMLLKHLDRFLSCFGGTEVIAVHKIIPVVNKDPALREEFVATLLARQSRRRK